MSPEEMQRLIIRETTRILLDVTENMIIQVATETICEFQDALSKRKEQSSIIDQEMQQLDAKLAQSKLKNAGLGVYGSDDSEDEPEPEVQEVKKPPKRTVVIEKQSSESTKDEKSSPEPEKSKIVEPTRSVSGERISVSGERSPSGQRSISKSPSPPKKQKKKKKKKKKRDSGEERSRKRESSREDRSRKSSRERSKKKKTERRRTSYDRDRRRRRRRSRE